MSELARDGKAESVSRDQILSGEQGQGKNHVSCSADHEHIWQPYPADPYSAAESADHTDVVHRVRMSNICHEKKTPLAIAIFINTQRTTLD